MTPGRLFQLDRTDALYRMMAGMVFHGKSPKATAEEFNVHEATVQNAMRANGVSWREAKRRIGWKGKTAKAREDTKARIAQRSASIKAKRKRIAALYATGMTLEAIGQAEGVSRERVRQQIVLDKGGRWISSLRAAQKAERRKQAALASQRRRIEGRQSKLARKLADALRHDGCWLHAGSVTKHGYAVENLSGGSRTLHRTVYAMVFGPIPAKMHVDHKCHNRSCINPDHLQLLTPSENCSKKRRGSFAAECDLRRSLGLPVHPSAPSKQPAEKREAGAA